MMKPSDKEFVAACGLADDPSVTFAAAHLPEELVAFGCVDTDSICAEVKMIDTGVMQPADSIDRIEFTFQMEKVLGITLNDNDVWPLVDAGVEDMEVGTRVRLVLDMGKGKVAQPSAATAPRLQNGHSEGAH